MDPARRGSADRGPAAGAGSRPGPSRGPGSGARLPPDAGVSAASLLGSGVPGGRRSSRPDAACDPFGHGCPRRAGTEERPPARTPPEGLPLPALLPPVPGGPPSPAAPGRAAFPAPGPPERREMLPKAESSDHIAAWAGPAMPRAPTLPKAVSSEFLAGGRVGLTPRAEPGELPVLAGPLGRLGPGDVCDPLPDCPDRAPEDGTFRITVVTWNVGTAMPPNDVTSLLHLNTGETNDVDMIAIGLQEVNSKINKRLKDALFTDQWSELFMDVLSPFHFILGNKGGVSVRLSIFGHMVCFLNCHLPAHLEKAEQRKEDFATILHMQQFEGPVANGILDHDLVFWFGDLNFRIESLDICFVKYAIDSNVLSQLWEKDQPIGQEGPWLSCLWGEEGTAESQLNIAKSTWPVLRGFQEGPLNFPPTFKFDVGTNKYDSSAKKRKPAWTDRILWKIKPPSKGWGTGGHRPSQGVLSVSQLCYCSHMEYTVSDHKPVAAIFAVQFASKVDKPQVEIYVADEWSRPEQAVVRYKMAVGFHRSSWDWIGLYRVGFRHPKDYVSYVWARSDEGERCLEKQLCAQVMFSEEALPKGNGEYILGYYSNTSSSIAGVTEPFQISLPRSEEGSSSTDSSGSSSEEDDSTLVLLAPKSRSPSPGKMKRHRSRSPSLAKFQGLILRPSSRDRGTSRSPSPQSRRSLPRNIPTIHLPQEELGYHGVKGKELGQAAESLEGSSFYQTVEEQGGLRRVSADSPLARADPRNLGLLPALRLEMIDQALGRRWESADQGYYPCRKMSPTSLPGCGTSPKEGRNPQELDRHSCAMGH
ncbi:phosphatidylinositol 4,5-bisphosphate 5-phosphatase A isoform X6 [Corvus kubaryi]|uniref:phosphatidylinositol 4,5-bisphosphate 5-phosphatase A isoform X6 n=1 Tax=Corvus kubaryi TaxID=68294 RepID=UPI001C059469|nr:phosphatidylinositol 4,5-bisphosphate 5-phosphatase A isoform X6 [Corvus kubaryi]